MKAQIVRDKNGFVRLTVKHACGHTVSYLYGNEEAAQAEAADKELNDCPVCHNQKAYDAIRLRSV